MPDPIRLKHANGRLTIDIGAIVSNWKKLSKMAPRSECAGVVKADAYGLGGPVVGKALHAAGCKSFFVATVEEGIALRKAVGSSRIYIFNGFNPDAITTYRKSKLIPILSSLRNIEDWLSTKPARQKATELECAINLGTGMNRLGLTAEELVKLFSNPDQVAQLNPQLLMSHFACADEPNHKLNKEQIKLFIAAADNFPNAQKSMANSAGVQAIKASHYDLLRPGIALYGGEAVNDVPNPMKPVIRLESKILQIKTVLKGHTVGYGAPEKLKRDTVIAVCGIGYADGLHRAASGAGTLFRKKTMSPGGMGMIGKYKVPILGRISMDLTTFDVTDVPKRLLDKTEWIDIINKELKIDDLARAAGTIGYEILTSLGRRYERIYIHR